MQERAELARELVGRAENVRVVLAKGADAGEPVHDAAALVTMEAAEVGHAPRELAVAAVPVPEDQTVRRAVHRLLAEALQIEELLDHDLVASLIVGAVRLGAVRRGPDAFAEREAELVEVLGGDGEVHVLPVVREVTARLEELLVEDLRRHDLFVAVHVVEPAHEILEAVVDEGAARQEERHRRRVLVEHEELELFAQLAMVALLRLGDELHVRFEGFLRGERRAVDALEHRVALVAAPVRARHADELDGADRRGGGHVRTLADVDPRRAFARVVERDLLALRDGVDDLRLVRLAHLREERLGLFARDDVAAERALLADDLDHRGFDLREVVLGERARRLLEVVIKARVGRGTDRDFGARENALDGFGHHVRRRVAEHA